MQTSGRISSITVKSLFGMFDHYIPLKDEGITIIHGLNGYGKTTVLRMVYDISRGRFNHLAVNDFKTIEVKFVDGKTLVITKEIKEITEGKRKQPSIKFELIDFQNLTEPFEFEPGAKVIEDEEVTHYFRRFLPFLKRAAPGEWIDQRNGERLYLEEIAARYEDLLPKRFEKLSSSWPSWLSFIVKSTNCRFIEAQRLLLETIETNKARTPWEDRPDEQGPRTVVARDAKMLSDQLNKRFNEYASKAQVLDRSFPARVVAPTQAPLLSEEVIIKELSLIEEKRTQLVSAGLLNQEETSLSQNFEISDPGIKKVLAIYIEDMKEKLSIFSETYERLDAFMQVINSRFSFKKITTNKEKGIIAFEDRSGRIIPLEALSSGEQHILVMMYELIFSTEQGDLLLIDEPELSLHVSWQRSFLDDLERILKINGLYAIVATHSPQIIADRWNLAVSLSEHGE